MAKCPLCDRPVVGNWGLGQHFRWHHPGQLEKLRAVRCEHCGKMIKAPPSAKAHLSYAAKRRYCSQHCRGLVMQGKQHPNYKGGCIDTTTGYRRIGGTKRWNYEHRIVMEAALGRCLTRNEHVHHKNGDKLDNRLENLQVLSASEHRRLHCSKRNI